MKTFFSEHPLISLLMVATICETSIIIAKTIFSKPKSLTVVSTHWKDIEDGAEELEKETSDKKEKVETESKEG